MNYSDKYKYLIKFPDSKIYGFVEHMCLVFVISLYLLRHVKEKNTLIKIIFLIPFIKLNTLINFNHVKLHYS